MNYDEKLFQAYDWAYQRVHQYDSLIAERANIFLLFSSLLFTGFIMLFQQLGGTVKILNIVIALVGVILSLQNMTTQIRGIRELRYWRNICRVIEEEDEPFSPLKEKDLVYIGYTKWINGSENRYTKGKNIQTYRTAPLSKFEKKYLFKVNFFHEWNTYRYIIPIAFIVLWVAGLIWVLIP